MVDGNLKSPFDGQKVSWVLSSTLEEAGGIDSVQVGELQELRCLLHSTLAMVSYKNNKMMHTDKEENFDSLSS